MENSAIAIKIETPPAPVVQNDGAVILSIIDRMASNPDMPVEKIERMMDMHERMQREASRRAYLAAFALMQPELPVIVKRGTIKTNEKTKDGTKTGNQIEQSKYALWEDVCEGIMPIVAKHRFSLSFRIAQPTPDRVVVTAVLGHADGHQETTDFGLPIDTSGSKNNVQGWGSSVSYGKRYTAFAMLNITARGEDDDGRKGGANETISEAQYKELADLIRETGTDLARFLAIGSVESLSDIPAAQFEAAKAKLLVKKAQKAKVAAQ